jgi:hypothetical protein
MLGRINRILIIALLTTFVFPVVLAFFRWELDDSRVFYAFVGSGIGALIWCALNVKSEPRLTLIALLIIVATILLSLAVPAIT